MKNRKVVTRFLLLCIMAIQRTPSLSLFEEPMNKIKFYSIIPLILTTIFLTGCNRNTDSVWEDTKTASRHVKRGMRALGGKHGDSRQINARDEFICSNDPYSNAPSYDQSDEFIPLADDPNNDDLAMADMVTRPPRQTPGDPGCSIPGIESFQDPATNSSLSGVFRNVYFAYNSSLVKGTENLETIRNVANYMRHYPNTYIFVEGHCDERGPEAYNLALGSHRSNAVRNLLINEGISPDNIFTVSYGKERPLVFGNDEESFQQNRRAEFKVYQR